MIRNLISVIIPFKNEELYILECMQSILIQNTENFDIEVILIDDHSIDQSPALVKSFCVKNRGFYYKLNLGKGIVDALSLGLKYSKGNFIHRMDADDIMPHNKLACFFNILLNNPQAKVATGKVKYFRIDKNLGEGFKKYEQWLNNLVINNSYYTEIYKECSLASANWFIGKEDLLKVGGFGVNYPEDYDLLFRFSEANYKIIGSNEITHLWRDHSERASRNDAHYLDNNFLELKLHWFLKKDFDSTKELIVLGAGKKGKSIAKLLINSKVKFRWLTNNKKKIGVNIYNQILGNYDSLVTMRPFQCLVFIANPTEQQELMRSFKSQSLTKNRDYYFFC